jgi:predicted NUDIX family NTP pyrophosphohydrolase
MVGPKRSRHSAGLLAYRRSEGNVEVFLVHPGGPFWASKDEGAWSIPKGEHFPAEAALEAAQREFREETGLSVSGPFVALPPIKQAGGKWVQAWAVEAPQLEPARLQSNLFALEWPPHSGQQRQFPEVDRAAWFSLAQAERKLLRGQRGLLQALRAVLEYGAGTAS